MSLLKYIERLRRIDDLIHRKATGTPEEFAAKLGLSRSVLMENLKDLKELGAPIAYDSYRRSYFYTDEFTMLIGGIDMTSARLIRGGMNFGVSKIEEFESRF